ncbi:MAG: twin-arginine translocase TatA/TatE family subunit [Chlorobiaceae bacterium]|nr:twin-arginine translocase TatA/TatE family subunit [Chlorobiaceae bacterium]MBA4310434.1 twin-arginine translocase TatA/TatE family subunit [Chlorobiaceae bacterium]
MFSNIGATELIVIVVVALLIFGPKKLPEIFQNFGKAMNHFKKSMNEVQDEFKNIDKDKPL